MVVTNLREPRRLLKIRLDPEQLVRSAWRRGTDRGESQNTFCEGSGSGHRRPAPYASQRTPKGDVQQSAPIQAIGFGHHAVVVDSRKSGWLRLEGAVSLVQVEDNGAGFSYSQRRRIFRMSTEAFSSIPPLLRVDLVDLVETKSPRRRGPDGI